MDLDDDELKATRKLHNCDNTESLIDNRIFEELEIMLNTLYSNCKNNSELNKMSIEISKISFKEISKRKKELKNGII